jgi:hypothetical protein
MTGLIAECAEDRLFNRTSRVLSELQRFGPGRVDAGLIMDWTIPSKNLAYRGERNG